MLRPGATVKPDTVILELSNPDLQQSVMEAQLAWASAQANYANRKAELESQLLNQRAGVANIEAQYKNATLNARGARTAVQGRARLGDAVEAVARGE